MKRSKIMFFALVIGLLACIFTWSYMGDTMNNLDNMNSSAEAVGASIAMTMALPHAVLSSIALIFCAVAWLFKLRWSALVAGILYAVSIVLMIPWFYLVVVQMVLCFVGYSKMGKAARGATRVVSY